MNNEHTTMGVSIHFCKGKEHLKSVMKLAKTLMTNYPKMRAEVYIYANSDDPNSCLRVRHMHTLDELKHLVHKMLTDCEVWEYFEIQ